MELSPEEAAPVRRWLNEDPVGRAHVVHLAFSEPGESALWVDDPDHPTSVMVHHRGKERLVLTSRMPSALTELLRELPSGDYRLSSVDLDLLPAVEEVLDLEMNTPVWLFRLDPEDFRPSTVVETEPVRPEDAERIARAWHPDRDATDYVRSRIVEGITAGIYRDGQIVAWDLTHFETDRVVMLGLLHVLEPYRGRGYAKTVTTSTVRQTFARGKIPACQVFEDNEASMNLTESMGFRRVKRQAWGTAVKG